MRLIFTQASKKRRSVPRGDLARMKDGPMREHIDNLDTMLETTAREVMKTLRKAGCETVRQKGSHAQVRCPPRGKQTTVPMHSGKDIKKGTLRSMERSLDMDLDGDGKPPPHKPRKEDVELEEARKKKVSVDAIIEFKHEGKKVVAKMVSSVWSGGGDMAYTWMTSKGETIETAGVPKPFKVISDVAPKNRR